MQEVITSQNSSFVLIGGKAGSISICSSMLQLTPLKAMQFFTHDVEKKQQKCLQLLQQLEARYQAYMTMQQNLCKKDLKVNFFPDQGSGSNSKKVKTLATSAQTSKQSTKKGKKKKKKDSSDAKQALSKPKKSTAAKSSIAPSPAKDSGKKGATQKKDKIDMGESAK